MLHARRLHKTVLSVLHARLVGKTALRALLQASVLHARLVGKTALRALLQARVQRASCASCRALVSCFGRVRGAARGCPYCLFFCFCFLSCSLTLRYVVLSNFVFLPSVSEVVVMGFFKLELALNLFFQWC